MESLMVSTFTKMALIPVKPLHLFFYFLLLLPVAFSTPLKYKTLLLKPLTIPHPLTPAGEIQIGDTAASFNLHHIDSLLSLNATPESLFNLRLQRDAKRANSLFSAVGGGYDGSGFNTSVISLGSDSYFVRLGIGTPPVYSNMILDTGSDITWIQCLPCKKCYDQTDQLFNPAISTSYSSLAHKSDLCRRLDTTFYVPLCAPWRKGCLYKVNYDDRSFTKGDFATETLTFGGKKITNFAFGCGHYNGGLFSGHAAGLIGLSRGDLSFTSQIGKTFDYKFSYCLVDRYSSKKPSILMFGNVSQTALYTPLLTNPKIKNFYYLELLGFSVGGIRVPGISPQMFRFNSAGNGGVMIDSGTSVTRLTYQAYDRLRDAFREGMHSELRKPVTKYSLFDTCYDLSGIESVKAPIVVLHFTGADLALPPQNFLIPVDSTGTFCFAFAAWKGKSSIIGNIQQQGFRIVYDLAGSRIGFSEYHQTCDI